MLDNTIYVPTLVNKLTALDLKPSKELERIHATQQELMQVVNAEFPFLDEVQGLIDQGKPPAAVVAAYKTAAIQKGAFDGARQLFDGAAMILAKQARGELLKQAASIVETLQPQFDERLEQIREGLVNLGHSFTPPKEVTRIPALQNLHGNVIDQLHWFHAVEALRGDLGAVGYGFKPAYYWVEDHRDASPASLQRLLEDPSIPLRINNEDDIERLVEAAAALTREQQEAHQRERDAIREANRKRFDAMVHM